MKYFFLLTFLLLSLAGFSQEQTEMADALRQDGKFWVVVVCVCVILFGLLAWVFMLDRKIAKLEKEQLNK